MSNDHSDSLLNPHPYQRALKRGIDLAVSAALLVILWPLMLGVALLIRSTMGRPVLFRQQRPGLRGRIFVLYKFRTMNDDRHPAGALLPDADRLTRLGRFLRRFSLDELPQLWNVLCGDMSLVGPRPLLTKYLSLYSPQQARRMLVVPGITGWAQVNGRNGISWEEKFALDAWYVDHWSLGLDLRIVLLSVANAWRGEGITAVGHATMPEFTGSSPARKEAA
jgi:sugar transferase EpsL